MHNRLIIIGAGGHGKVIADIAMKNGYTNICFADDNAAGKCMGLPIIGSTSVIQSLNDGSTEFVIGIGNNAVRENIAKTYDVNWTTLVHPSAQIAEGVSIGRGTVIMAGAVVNACAVIGSHCIINTCAVVEHDNLVEDYAHISPGACLAGNVHIGARTHICIGAVVRNSIRICEDCTIGAGSVVVKNIIHHGIYVGVPAREMV